MRSPKSASQHLLFFHEPEAELAEMSRIDSKTYIFAQTKVVRVYVSVSIVTIMRSTKFGNLY